MAITHYLVTDAPAEEVERKIGLRGHDTIHGVLVEQPKPVDIHGMMAEINLALNPTRCTCGMFAIVHHPKCSASEASD